MCDVVMSGQRSRTIRQQEVDKDVFGCINQAIAGYEIGDQHYTHTHTRTHAHTYDCVVFIVSTCDYR